MPAEVELVRATGRGHVGGPYPGAREVGEELFVQRRCGRPRGGERLHRRISSGRDSRCYSPHSRQGHELDCVVRGHHSKLLSVRAPQTGVTRAADTCAPRYAAGTQQDLRKPTAPTQLDAVTCSFLALPTQLTSTNARVVVCALLRRVNRLAVSRWESSALRRAPWCATEARSRGSGRAGCRATCAASAGARPGR